MINNKVFEQELPYENIGMFQKFEKVIEDIRNFSIKNFTQENVEKCKRCIYCPACGVSKL